MIKAVVAKPPAAKIAAGKAAAAHMAHAMHGMGHMGGGGFAGGDFRGGRFGHDGFDHGRRFARVGPFLGYDDYGYGSDCWTPRRVHTRAGWRTSNVWTCSY